MPASTTRRSRAKLHAVDGDSQPETSPAERPRPVAAPDPVPAKPAASVDLGARPVTYHFPKVTLSDGTTVECPHQLWGHREEKAAKSCASALAHRAGHRIG